MVKLRVLAIGLLLATGLVASLGATTLVRMSEKEMATSADLIVVGRCTHVESARLGRSIVTQVTIGVADTLKGRPGNGVTVVVPGGVDLSRPVPIAQTWPGAPRFAAGQDVFLFLRRQPEVKDGYAVIGFSQGAFSVVTDAQGQKMVQRDLSGISLADGKSVVTGGKSAVPLADFERQVRDLLGAGGQKQPEVQP